MSKATKRKHVQNEAQQDDYSVPTADQQIVRVLAGRGNNLHEVQLPDGTTYLASMPTKFRKNLWVKRGDYVLVEPISEGVKVRGEIVRVLTPVHIKYFRKDGVWPGEFERLDRSSEGDKDEDGMFVNRNRAGAVEDKVTSESSSDESSDSDTEKTYETGESDIKKG